MPDRNNTNKNKNKEKQNVPTAAATAMMAGVAVMGTGLAIAYLWRRRTIRDTHHDESIISSARASLIAYRQKWESLLTQSHHKYNFYQQSNEDLRQRLTAQTKNFQVSSSKLKEQHKEKISEFNDLLSLLHPQLTASIGFQMNAIATTTKLLEDEVSAAVNSVVETANSAYMIS
jgi:hypothetical protein